MGIVSLSRLPILSVLFAPMQALAAWFVPTPRFSSPRVINAEKTGAPRPALGVLKIVREFDSTISPACTGRMIISGRMADVCAELERLARQ